MNEYFTLAAPAELEREKTRHPPYFAACQAWPRSIGWTAQDLVRACFDMGHHLQPLKTSLVTVEHTGLGHCQFAIHNMGTVPMPGCTVRISHVFVLGFEAILNHECCMVLVQSYDKVFTWAYNPCCFGHSCDACLLIHHV